MAGHLENSLEHSPLPEHPFEVVGKVFLRREYSVRRGFLCTKIADSKTPGLAAVSLLVS